MKLRTSEVAKLIGFSQRTVNRWAAEGKIPGATRTRPQYKDGQPQWRFPPESVRWLQSQLRINAPLE